MAGGTEDTDGGSRACCGKVPGGACPALADWKPEEANRLSDSLEEALDTLEKLMPTDA